MNYGWTAKLVVDMTPVQAPYHNVPMRYDGMSDLDGILITID